MKKAPGGFARGLRTGGSEDPSGELLQSLTGIVTLSHDPLPHRVQVGLVALAREVTLDPDDEPGHDFLVTIAECALPLDRCLLADHVALEVIWQRAEGNRTVAVL